MTFVNALRPLVVVPLICIPLLAAARPTAARTDGAELIYPTTGKVSAQNPALSPDGQTLVFTRYTNGYDGSAGGLWKMPADGGTATAVINKYGATNVNGLATWNAAVNLITFADINQDGDVWVIAPDGTGLRKVTDEESAPGHAYQEPTFAPDGQTIVLEDDLDNGKSSDGYVGAIDVVPTSGGPIKRLVTDGDNRLPVWSPDGTRILFQRRTDVTNDGVYYLFTINADGSGLTQITGVGSTVDNCDSDASWSADGKWILDSACYGKQTPCPGDHSVTESNIFLVSADGSTVIRATSNPGEEDGAPTMSPDGQWIYFESHRAACDDDSPAQIWRIASPVH